MKFNIGNYIVMCEPSGQIQVGDFNVPSDFNHLSDLSVTSQDDLEIVNDSAYGYMRVISITKK